MQRGRRRAITSPSLRPRQSESCAEGYQSPTPGPFRRPQLRRWHFPSWTGRATTSPAPPTGTATTSRARPLTPSTFHISTSRPPAGGRRLDDYESRRMAGGARRLTLERRQTVGRRPGDSRWSPAMTTTNKALRPTSTANPRARDLTVRCSIQPPARMWVLAVSGESRAGAGASGTLRPLSMPPMFGVASRHAVSETPRRRRAAWKLRHADSCPTTHEG